MRALTSDTIELGYTAHNAVFRFSRSVRASVGLYSAICKRNDCDLILKDKMMPLEEMEAFHNCFHGDYTHE